MKKIYFLMGALAVSMLSACHNHDHEEEHAHGTEETAREDNHEEHADEIILTADDLPARESWENVCLELQRAGLEDAVCIAEGIKINLSH